MISDYECDICRNISASVDSLILKYKEQINFGFINFGSYPTISALAAESAAVQNKFWEMHDSLFDLKTLPDTNDIYRIAKEIGINIFEFKRDFHDKNLEEKVKSNIMKIINSGIYATPTVIIDNQFIFNSSSIAEMESLILKSLSKK